MNDATMPRLTHSIGKDSRMDTEYNANMARLTQPATHYAETLSRGMVSVGEEITNFVSRRARHVGETFAELSSNGTNPSKLLEIQIKWFTTTVQDYNDETQRLMQMQGKLLQEMIPRSRD